MDARSDSMPAIRIIAAYRRASESSELFYDTLLIPSTGRFIILGYFNCRHSS